MGMVLRPVVVAALVIAAILALPSSALAQMRGVPQSGFPSWQERMLLVYVNRARADPAADLAGCTVCAEKACYPNPVTPVGYSFELNRAARFHAANLEFGNRFQHDSPCALVTNLSSVYVPTGTCLGEASCACVGGTLTGTTATATRIARFTATSGWGENIAYGNTTPRSTFYQWFWEPETSSACGFRSTNGHRYNIVEPTKRTLGTGYYRISRHMWVQDFNGGATATGTLLAGGHEPQFSGGNVDFRVNYYNTGGASQAGVVNVDGVCTTMALERGGATNATYLASQTLAGTTCRRYRFEFVGPGATPVYLPETGSYGVGGSTACADWTATAPPACGTPPNQAPTIATGASATPTPVTATTTQLGVLGADDAGEAALTYTWSATGPTAVMFSANGSNAAKTTTATFVRSGSYAFTVTVRDAGNLTATSTVNVTVNQTLTTIAVSPSTASVMITTQQQFAATSYDQFSIALTTQPTPTWTVSGGGTINATGRFTAGATTGGPFTVTATSGGKSGTAQVTVTGPGSPTVAQGVVATPSPVTGTTTAATVLGASLGGEPALTYTWTGSGPAAITANPNGTNAAKSTTITFTTAGTYTLTAMITDGSNQSATSSTTVVVEATPTTAAIMPATAVVVINESRAFSAQVTDQFGAAATATPVWSISGGGTVDAQGTFTAGDTPGGPYLLTATAGGATGSAQIIVAETEDTTPPTVMITSPTDGAVLTGSTQLVADATDDLGVAKVVFTVDGQQLEVTSAPYQISWEPAADGTYTIEARAIDLAGNHSPPSTITVEVVTAGAGGAEEGDGGGCCGSGRGGTGGLLLAGIVAIVLRRRRR